MSDHRNHDDCPREVRFTIDGRRFSTTDRKQPAAALLRLAGLDPACYDLAEIRRRCDEPRRYSDDQIVRIDDGDKFVTIRQCAQVA